MTADDLQLSAVLSTTKPQGILGPAKNAGQAAKAAEDFEAVFINEFMGAMFEGIKTDGPFGGGPGESIFRSMMIDQYSKAVAKQGGFGLAAAVKKELLHAQENAR
jgi:Rod binding domain-containing protein